MSDPLLGVRRVGWRCGAAAVLKNVSFEVAAGELVAIMGRNGAGKSTLLDVIAGLRRATEGTTAIAGRSLDQLSPNARARLIAHLPQATRGDLAIRAEELVLMGRYPHAAGWLESSTDREIADAAMRRCDCLDFRRRTLATLSGGERQRVYLAACLAQQPRLLLLDEPATFMDIDQQLRSFAILRQEAERGTACLAVTHDINLALTFCTRLIVLDAGAIAHDLDAGAALDAPDWLRLFSPRLDVRVTAGAPPWVAYR